MQEAQEPEWLLRRRREEKHNAPRRLYGTLDATKVHIREGEEGSRWRDLKIGAWFETDSTPPATPDREWQIKAKNISYYGDICPVEHFSPLVWATGVRRHANLAEELIMIGDGAEWIWNLVTAHFPDAVQILDWFHAVEHLTPVAQAAFKSEETQKEWLKTMRDCLWEGQTETVIRSCRNLNERTPHEEIRKAAAYFETNQKRMRYDWFRSQGYQIGSGTIESAAKQIGMMRMKVPGAIWNEEHAILVSKARGAVLSYNWQSLPLAG